MPMKKPSSPTAVAWAQPPLTATNSLKTLREPTITPPPSNGSSQLAVSRWPRTSAAPPTETWEARKLSSPRTTGPCSTQ